MQSDSVRDRGTPVALACALWLLGACGPPPLPLPADPDDLLQITDASPALGVVHPPDALAPYLVTVKVDSSSRHVSGRLYLHNSESCCELNVENPQQTRFLQQAATENLGENHYRISFTQATLPCVQGAAGANLFLVLVLATGGFPDGESGFRPDGLGLVDRAHYWTIVCP